MNKKIALIVLGTLLGSALVVTLVMTSMQSRSKVSMREILNNGKIKTYLADRGPCDFILMTEIGAQEERNLVIKANCRASQDTIIVIRHFPEGSRSASYEVRL